MKKLQHLDSLVMQKHTWRVKNEIPVWGTVSTKYPFNEFFLDAGGNVRTNSGE